VQLKDEAQRQTQIPPLRCGMTNKGRIGQGQLQRQGKGNCKGKGNGKGKGESLRRGGTVNIPRFKERGGRWVW